MILDSLLQFSATAGDLITTSGGVIVSTNVIDLGIGATATTGIPLSTAGGGARDIGIGDDPAMKILVLCGGTFAGGTSIIITLQGAIDDGTGVPAAFSAWWASPTYLLAGLTAGTRLMDMDMPRPPAGVAIPRFLRLGYTVAGTFTGATSILKAYLVLDRDDQFYSSTNNAIMGGYPAGINVAN